MNNMQKAQKYKKRDISSDTELRALQCDVVELLDDDPEYSLQADPKGIYRLNKTQKLFIEAYSQFKNVNAAANIAKIDIDSAKDFFGTYACQQEIRRINAAMCQRQFAHKILTLDEIGGFLSSIITDNVPVADRVDTMDKVNIARTLIDLNKYKRDLISDGTPSSIRDISDEIKELSVDTIQKLLTQSESNEIRPLLDEKSLTPEERAYLDTLSTKELLSLIESTNKKETN